MVPRKKEGIDKELSKKGYYIDSIIVDEDGKKKTVYKPNYTICSSEWEFKAYGQMPGCVQFDSYIKEREAEGIRVEIVSTTNENIMRTDLSPLDHKSSELYEVFAAVWKEYEEE